MIPASRNSPSGLVIESFSVPVCVLISLRLASVIAALEESCTTPATVAALNCASERRPIQNASGNKDFELTMRQKRIMGLRFTGFEQRSVGFSPTGLIWLQRPQHPQLAREE